MFVKVFELHPVLTVEDIYLLHVRIPIIDKLICSVSGMMFVAWRPFPVPVCLSSIPTYSPVNAIRLPPLWEKFATNRLNNVTACNPWIGHPRSDMEPYPHFARIRTIWLQTSLVAKVGWWRRIVSVWRYRNARTLDRMLDYRPLRHTEAGGAGLIKTISVACLQSNNVLSVWEAWNG